MKTPRKLRFSLWLTLITALAPMESIKAGGDVDPNHRAPFFENADMLGREIALPDGNVCTFFSDNFDGVTAPALPAGWVATNAQGAAPLWVTSTTTPDSAPNDAFIDDPPTVSDKRLDTPSIAISLAGAQLIFRNFYNLENTFDGGVLEVSSPNINGGAFTDITSTAVGGSFVTGGYNATIGSAFGNPIAGRQAWSGNSGGYINTVANLGPNVNGRIIKLRFRMGSDNSAAAPGWRVDTIRVTAPGTCPTPTPTPPACSSSNGGLNPRTLSENEVFAPTGFFWSEVQHNAGNNTEANTNAGYADTQGTNRLADNFTLTQACTINSVAFYGYLTGSPATPSPFTAYTLQIHNGRPGDPGVAVVFGNTTTNRLASSVDSTFYRIFNTVVPPPGTAPGTTRKIWKNTVTVGITLPPGTYWLDWASTVTGGVNHFAPSKTIPGARGAAGDNARQFAAGAWVDVIDVGNPATAPDVPQDFPFDLNGTPSTVTPTPSPTVTVTPSATPTATPGATPTPTPTPTPSPPVITSPLTALTIEGLPFVYQFEATGATSLAVFNLPPGLLFNSTLGAIVGTPDAAGTFQVGLSAINSGGTTNRTLIITVQAFPPAGPVIGSATAATGRVGQPFSFRVFTIGGTSAATIRASGLPPGGSINVVPGVPGLISGTPTVEGSSAVTLTVTDGAFTTSSILELTFTVDPARPVIISPRSASLTPGQFFTYQIRTDAPGQTTFTVIGTLPAGLGFDGIDTISGTYTGPLRPELGGGILGSIQLFGTNFADSATFQLDFRLRPPSGVVNIATRLLVSTGENVLIGGFIITGSAPKVVLIRAIGPSLNPFLPGALQDPTLELHGANTDLILSNDNWRDTQEQFIRETEIPPADNRESAIVIGLDPGSYTAIVRGKSDTTGIAVVEVYDLGTASLNGSGNDKLGNIATRGFVDTGDNVMIGGFIIQIVPTRVVVRAIGPSLSAFGIAGALQDPTLELKDANGVTLISNDDWQLGRPPAEVQEIQQLGLAPSDPRESALITTPALAPGGYTAIVRGKGGTTGVALVEVYGLP